MGYPSQSSVLSFANEHKNLLTQVATWFTLLLLTLRWLWRSRDKIWSTLKVNVLLVLLATAIGGLTGPFYETLVLLYDNRHRGH